MSKIFWILGGAGLMYLLDPERGKKRREAIRDKATGVLDKAGDTIEEKGNEIRKQAHAIVADARSSVSKTASPK